MGQNTRTTQTRGPEISSPRPAEKTLLLPAVTVAGLAVVVEEVALLVVGVVELGLGAVKVELVLGVVTVVLLGFAVVVVVVATLGVAAT